MKVSFLRIAIILLLVFTAQAFGQAGMQMQAGYLSLNLDFRGAGARAQGMGGAFLGLSNDINGGSWNPAGLYDLESPQMGFGYGSLVPSGNSYLHINVVDNSYGKNIVHDGSLNKLTSLNFVAPLRVKGHKFVGTFSYSRTFDEYSQESLDYQIPVELFGGSGIGIESYIENNYALSNYIGEITGGMYTINIGAGTRLYDKISFGLTANIYTGNLVKDGYQVTTLNNVGSIFTYGQNAEHIFYGRALDSLKFSGINFNLGFKYNGDKFSAGLLLRTPLALGVSADSTRSNVTTINGNPVLESIVLSPKINPHLTKYELPMMVGLGLAYNIQENLIVDLDLEYRQYNNATIKIRDSLKIEPSGDNIEYYTSFDPSGLYTVLNKQGAPSYVYTFKWNNALVIRLGGEYMMESKYGKIPLRAGFGYIPVPGSSIDKFNFVGFDTGGNPVFEEKTNKQVNWEFSLGTGIHWEQILLDIAYTYSRRDFNFHASTFNMIDGSYYYRNHRINFTFTGYF